MVNDGWTGKWGRRGQLGFTLQTNAFEYSLPFLESKHFGTWQTMKQTIHKRTGPNKVRCLKLRIVLYSLSTKKCSLLRLTS